MNTKSYNWAVLYDDGRSIEIKNKPTVFEVIEHIMINNDKDKISCIMKLDEVE